MADRIEREIDEILERLSGKQGGSREPIRFSRAGRHGGGSPGGRRRPLLPRIEPATLMFSGAAIMLIGLVLSTFSDPFIWAAFAGVLMFVAAFVLSFARGWPSVRSSGGGRPQGVYWRDRYIQYDEPEASPWDRIRRLFRR